MGAGTGFRQTDRVEGPGSGMIRLTCTPAFVRDLELERDMAALEEYRTKFNNATSVPVVGCLLRWYYGSKIKRYETEANMVLSEYDR